MFSAVREMRNAISESIAEVLGRPAVKFTAEQFDALMKDSAEVIATIRDSVLSSPTNADRVFKLCDFMLSMTDSGGKDGAELSKDDARCAGAALSAMTCLSPADLRFLLNLSFGMAQELAARAIYELQGRGNADNP